MAQRILLLSAAFGSGHLQAARAIAQACREQDARCETSAVNLQNWGLQQITSGYLSLLRHAPGMYQRLYRLPVGRGTRSLLRSALYPAVCQAISRFEPTLVVATHPFPGAVASYLRRTGRLRAPVAMAVTDFIPHPFWVESGVDRYFVPAPEAARRLTALGVAPDLVRVTGIPVRSEFRPPGIFAGVAAHRDATRRVLVMGGGLGLGPIVEAVRSLAVLPQRDLHVTVVCGSNRDLELELTDLFGDDPRFQIIGYTSRIPELMAQADLLVSKPGGITCSEAMACKLPTLLLRPLPGQEEENADYLTGVGAAMPVTEMWVGTTAAQLLFSSPERLVRMRESCRLAGRPDAARHIAAEIFRLAAREQARDSLADTHESLPSMAIS